MIETGRVEQRRHPRMRVSWPVILEAEGQLRYVETIDVGARGAKLRLEAAPPLGSPVLLHVLPPEGGELHVEALTWRIDPDGVAFFFIGLAVPVEEQERFIGEDAAELALA
ncbi:MAG TPA: PilZ domain-containing protein [Candidatus Bathyarchaeia archaeon]|nr:PilZ domain-containing protein [Candidatus Bathyarchaeia archaeon]